MYKSPKVYNFDALHFSVCLPIYVVEVISLAILIQLIQHAIKDFKHVLEVFPAEYTYATPAYMVLDFNIKQTYHPLHKHIYSMLQGTCMLHQPIQPLNMRLLLSPGPSG